MEPPQVTTLTGEFLSPGLSAYRRESEKFEKCSGGRSWLYIQFKHVVALVLPEFNIVAMGSSDTEKKLLQMEKIINSIRVTGKD